jgi:hypothetical protein
VEHEVFKQRLDATGRPIHDVQKSDVSVKIDATHAENKKNASLATCGDCYGGTPPPSGCCNTCDDVRKAYQDKAWNIDDYDKFAQVSSTLFSHVKVCR